MNWAVIATKRKTSKRAAGEMPAAFVVLNRPFKLRRENEAAVKLQKTVSEMRALINSQSAELGSLNRQLEVLKKNNSESLHVSCRAEIEKLRRNM